MGEKRRLATERGVWSDAYRELLKPSTVAIALASVVLFVVAMTIFGPLGTLEALAPLHRFGYWALCAVITFPLCYAWAAVALYLTRRRSLFEMTAAAVAAVLFEGLFCTAVMLAADLLFLPAHAPPLGLVRTYLTVTIVVGMCTLFAHYGVFMQLSHRRAAAAADRSAHGAHGGSEPAPDAAAGTPRTPAPGAAAPPGAGSTAGAAAPARSADDVAGTRAPGTTEPRARTTAPAGRPSAAPEPPTASQARFYERLSRAVSRDIIYLRADDHYVHVHTSGGSCLVRNRFANAVADLGALGMQVHRSYWVAHRHMITTVRRDGRLVLRVTGGENLPISRPYLAAVRAALDPTQGRPAGGDPFA